MNASRADAQPGEWDKVLIMGKQLAPDDALFAGAQRAVAADLDMELHSSDGPLDMDLGADLGTMTDIDVTSVAALAPGEAGLDFVIDEPVRGADGASSLEPTVENPRINVQGQPPTSPTQEVPIEELGIDVGDFGSLDDLIGTGWHGRDAQGRRRGHGRESAPVAAGVRPAARRGRGRRPPECHRHPEGADRHPARAGRRRHSGSGPDGGRHRHAARRIETPRLGAGKVTEVDFAIGEEAATMSEVGTKLDLARAYIDMGDPEGARSILDEVLKEGSAVQKQEAERLMSSLP